MNIFEKIFSKLSRKITHLQRDISGMLGIHHTFFRSARGSRIIIYHGVCHENATRFNTLFVTEKAFEDHLRFYKKYFNTVSLDDFYQKKFVNNKFNICLTFDDGFANNYKYVLPLLEKYDIPAIFFITAIRKEGYNILWNDFLTISSITGPQKLVFNNEKFSKQKGRTYISELTKKTLAETLRSSGFDEKKKLMELMEPYASFEEGNAIEDYWLQMSVEEIREAACSLLITIGSHGFYHNDLGRIPAQDMYWELKESKLFLENIIQKQITQLAFPYGNYSADTIEQAAKAGYEQLLAAEFLYQGDANNVMLRERMGVNPFISTTNQMHAIIKGNYE